MFLFKGRRGEWKEKTAIYNKFSWIEVNFVMLKKKVFTSWLDDVSQSMWDEINWFKEHKSLQNKHQDDTETDT